MNIRITILTGLLAGAALALAACDSGSKQVETISFGGPPNISALALVALDKGYFKDEGVDVTYVPIQTGKLSLDTVTAGHVDVGITIDANLVGAARTGSTNFKALAIVQRKIDDGIAYGSAAGIRQPGDLRGKRVGYIPGTSSNVFLNKFLAANGMLANDVKLVSATPPALQAAMIAGEIDAASVWQPFRTNILHAKPDAFGEFPNDGLYRCTIFMVTGTDYSQAHEDALRRFLHGLQRAQRFIVEDPAGAQAVVAKRMGLSPAQLKALWSSYSNVAAAPSSGRDALVSAYVALDPTVTETSPAVSQALATLDDRLWK